MRCSHADLLNDHPHGEDCAIEEAKKEVGTSIPPDDVPTLRIQCWYHLAKLPDPYTPSMKFVTPPAQRVIIDYSLIIQELA